MLHLRTSMWCAGLVVTLALAGPARADHGGAAPPKDEQRAAAPLERLLFLLPPGTTTVLNLNEQQTDQVIKLEYEFRAKRRGMMLALATQIASAFRADAPVREGAQPQGAQPQAQSEPDVAQLALAAFTGVLKMRELRDTYEVKVLEVLNAEQKKQFVELKRAPFAERMERREARREARIEHRAGYAPAHDHLQFSDDQKTKLNLTEEQKAKMADLHREMKEKFLNILTEEQKRQIEGRQQQRQPGATEKPATPEKQEKQDK